MSNILQSTYDAIIALDIKDQIDLARIIRKDLKFYAEIVMPHILTQKLDDEEKHLFQMQELPRETYMPEYQQTMYDNYSAMFNGIIDYLANVVFRGAAKTTIKNIAVSMAIGFGIFRCIVFISETKDQAAKDIAKVDDEVKHNIVFKKFFGKIDVLRDNAYEKVYYIRRLKKRIAIFATGMNGRIRGIHDLGARPDAVFVDDFESENNSLTPDGRNHVQIKINSQILNLTDSEYVMVFQGTIVHHETFLAQIHKLPMFMKKEHGGDGRGRYFMQPISNSDNIIFDEVRGRFIIKNPMNFDIGTPAWPRVHDYEKIKRRYKHYRAYRNGTELWQFFQELYNIPRSDTKIYFDSTKIFKIDAEFKTKNNINYLEYKDGTKIPCYTFFGIDPAAGREAHNDNTVAMTTCTIPTGQTIILDVLWGKLSLKQQVASVFDSHAKYKLTKAKIESFGYQLAFYEHVCDERRDRGINLYLSKYNRTNQSKSDKLKTALETEINGGMVGYIEGCRGIEQFLYEIDCFSVDNQATDDTLDAFFLNKIAAGGYKPHNFNVDQMIISATRAMNPFRAQTGMVNEQRFCKSYIYN